MICQRIMTEYAQFSAEETADNLRELIHKNCRIYEKGPCGDYDLVTGKCNVKRREQHQTCRDILTALAICNNVTPVQ